MASKLYQTKLGQMTRDLLYKFYCACIRTGFIDFIRVVIGLFSLMLFCCSLWMTGSTRSQSEVRQMNRYCLAGMCFPALRDRYTHLEFWFVHTVASWCLWLIRVICLNNSNTSQLAVIWHVLFMLVTARVNCITNSQLANNFPDLS